MEFNFKSFEKAVNICLLIFIVSIITWFLADIFITQKIDIKNTTELEIHFKEIVKQKIQGKVSYSYDIYNEDNEEVYKIGADYTGCFELDNFLQNVKKDDLIKIYLNKNNGLKKPNLKSVVGIVANGKNYIDLNCINEKIESNKIYIPLIFCILPVIFIISIIYNRRKNRKEKTNA